MGLAISLLETLCAFACVVSPEVWSVVVSWVAWVARERTVVVAVCANPAGPNYATQGLCLSLDLRWIVWAGGSGGAEPTQPGPTLDRANPRLCGPERENGGRARENGGRAT